MGKSNKRKYREMHAREKGLDIKRLKLRNTVGADGSRKIVAYHPQPSYTITNERVNIRNHFAEVIKKIGEVKYITNAVQGRAKELMNSLNDGDIDLNKAVRDISDIASNIASSDQHLTTSFVQIQQNGKKSNIFQFDKPISKINFLKVLGEYFRNIEGHQSWGVDFDPKH